MSAAISLRVVGSDGVPVKGAKYELLEADGTCFGEMIRRADDDSAVVVHFPDGEEKLTVRASKGDWQEVQTFRRSKVQYDFRYEVAPEHLVILIHGIRTHAFWYDRAKRVFTAQAGVRVEGARYGRFDLFSFMIPGPWRRGPIQKTKEKIRPLIVDANRLKHKITVIAHSNGTQVVTRILREDPLFEVDNLIMCGSVVDTNYDWYLVKSRVRGSIVNDYGTRDVWPAVAQSVTWGYGYSGTVGFGTPVKDRIFNCGHSDYFTEAFMRNYWLPLIARGEIVDSPELATDGEGRPWWFALWELPLRWVILAALFAVIALVALSFIHHVPGPPPKPDRIVSPTPAPGPSNPYFVQASFKDGNHFEPVDLYSGPAQNWLLTTDLKIVDGATSFATGESTDVDSGPFKLALASALARYSLSASHDAAEFKRCIATEQRFRSCSPAIQATAFDLLEYPTFEGSLFLDQIGDDLKRISADGFAAGSARPAGEMTRTLHLTVKNNGAQDRTITAIRFHLRNVFFAQGDGSVSDQPFALKPQPAGTLQLQRLFTVNCARPGAKIDAEIVLPGPVPIRAGGLNHIELVLDLDMRRSAAADVVTYFGSEDREQEPVAKRCQDMRDQRSTTLAAYPNYRAALAMLRPPMFDSYQNSAVEIALKDDRGTWNAVGTANFALP